MITTPPGSAGRTDEQRHAAGDDGVRGRLEPRRHRPAPGCRAETVHRVGAAVLADLDQTDPHETAA
jgi:hypothetical protein